MDKNREKIEKVKEKKRTNHEKGKETREKPTKKIGVLKSHLRNIRKIYRSPRFLLVHTAPKRGY
jgi:hypothetical protein